MKKYQRCLKDNAFITENTIGRRRFLEDDSDFFYFGLSSPFAVDENQKIFQSKAYRRMENKTQVFYCSGTPYTRTRMTHTTDVVVIASFLAEFLGLNTSLARAIAAGHDIGHVPFGHLGERFISKKIGSKFRHNVFSVIVAELIERWGSGLNLSYETLMGIYHHSGDWRNFDYSLPQEYLVAKIADKIAYTLADYNDAIRMGYVLRKNNDFEKLGNSQRSRTRNVLQALIKESAERGLVSFEKTETAKVFSSACDFMFDSVYAKADEDVDFSILEKSYELIEASDIFSECNPVIAFALISEEDVNLIASMSKKENNTPGGLGIKEILKGIKGLKINNFHSFPFKKEDFVL